MSARMNSNGELSVIRYSDNDDYDGNDFSRTLTFSPENTEKLQALLGVNAEELGEVIDRRFGHDMYDRSFDEFCQENSVHYRWVIHEEYSGGIHKEGEE